MYISIYLQMCAYTYVNTCVHILIHLKKFLPKEKVIAVYAIAVYAIAVCTIAVCTIAVCT